MSESPQNSDTLLSSIFELINSYGLEAMQESFEIILNNVMLLEREHFLHARSYERNPERKGYANGFKPKKLNTRLGTLSLNIPQVRDAEDSFYPNCLERGIRSERALTLALAEMYVQGVSTRRMTKITEELCGLSVSSSQVSKAAKLLDEDLSKWRERALGDISYMMLDARYENVRYGGSVISCAVLVAVGVKTDGKRSVLGVSVSLSEAEVHWRDFLQSLVKRGLRGVSYIVSDDHEGLKAARKAIFPGVPWQRCQCHLQRNAQAYVPKKAMKEEVAQDIRDIFNSNKRTEADKKLTEFVNKYSVSAPKLAEWAEINIPEGLTVFELPRKCQKKLRTTNGIERLNREIKRRTRVAALFPNEQSLLRLVTAVISEISDEWETDKVYISMKDL